MNRVSALQSILDAKRFPKRYLEIGVFDGACFFSVTGAIKTAVDPQFKFPSKRIVKSYLKHPSNVFNRYYQMPSDDYFAAHSATYDVVFVDGLHTYEQSLRDVENALACLNDGGIIVMHDCCPTSRSMAFPAESILDLSLEQIASAGYDDLDANRASWLNLKDPSYLEEIVSGLQ